VQDQPRNGEQRDGVTGPRDEGRGE
jgi:hypothetical protein